LGKVVLKTSWFAPGGFFIRQRQSGPLSLDPALMPRVPMIQAEYERQFELAAGEDREKAPVRFVPRMFYTR
jgi:hypothetical protein